MHYGMLGLGKSALQLAIDFLEGCHSVVGLVVKHPSRTPQSGSTRRVRGGRLTRCSGEEFGRAVEPSG